MKSSPPPPNLSNFRKTTAFLFFAVILLATVAVSQAQSGSNTPIRPRPALGPASTGNSSANGRVVYKDNSQPLKGARVRIFAANDSGNSVGLTAVTNDRGEFRVGNLAAGKYYVSIEGKGIAQPSGFGMKLPIPISAIPRREDFDNIVPRHDAQFTVDGNDTVEVEIKIARGGTITGKVLRPNGAPVANVAVSLVSRGGNSNGPYMSQFSTSTDKDGIYKIENLPEGDYVVGAAIEDKSANFDIRARLRGESQVVTYHPASISIRDAIAVNIAPGRETAGVNVTLVPRSTFAVSGSVMRQRDATPLVGATVLLRNKEADLGGSLVPGMGQRSVRTDAEGRWSFNNVMEGSYIVTALAPTSRSPRLPGEEPPDREQAFRESRQRFLVSQQEIVVAGSDVTSVSMAISGPGSIVGRVETDNGAPLPSDLVIFFELVGQANRPGPPMPVRVRPDGSFAVAGIQGGEVNFALALPPNSRYFIKSLSAHGSDLFRVPLRIEEGADAGPVQVVISQEVGLITGRLIAQNGQPTDDVVVLLAPVDPAKQRFRTSYLTSRPGADGSFSLTGAPGEYFVFARRRDDLPGIVTEEFVRTAAQNAQRIVLAPGEQKRLELRLD